MKKTFSEAHRRAISEARKGKPLSEAHRLAISQAKRGKPITERQRAAIRAATLGKVRTEETKQRLSESRQGKVRTAESIAKQRETARANASHRREPMPVEVFGVRYESQTEAAKALNMSAANVSQGVRTGRPGYKCLDPE